MVRLPALGSVVITVAMTACFSIDAATDPDGDGLWVIGAFLVLVGCSVGSLVVSHLAAARAAR